MLSLVLIGSICYNLVKALLIIKWKEKSKMYGNILYLREVNEKTQKEIANYINVTQTTYSKYERGAINIPIDVIIKLADYYDVSVDYLVGRRKWFGLSEQVLRNRGMTPTERTLSYKLFSNKINL